MKIPLHFFAIAALRTSSPIATSQDYTASVSLPGISGVTIYTGAPEGSIPSLPPSQSCRPMAFRASRISVTRKRTPVGCKP